MPGVTSRPHDHRGGDHRAGAGSDVAGLETRAGRRDGDHWVLNGSKPSSPTACMPTSIFVAARTGTARHAISMFIVEKGTPGFTVGRSLEKTGWLVGHRRAGVRGLPHPAANLLGEQDKASIR